MIARNLFLAGWFALLVGAGIVTPRHASLRAADESSPAPSSPAPSSPAPSSPAPSLPAPAEKPSAEALEFFENSVRPLLVKHCYECHSADSNELKGGLALDTRAGWKVGGDSGPAVIPGKPDESPLIEAVRYESFEMPPKGRLPEADVAVLVKWVNMGAPDPRDGQTVVAVGEIDLEQGRQYWAFQPPQITPPGEVRHAAWPVGEIDRYVLSTLESQGLQPAPPAEPAVWLRRVTYDLTGLPPLPEEIDAFLADARSDARQRVVDRLLASPQFGVHWGRHWLDVARYADSNGSDFNATFYNAWRYRNYVVDAFNEDKPYIEFIREQIAGDLLPASDDEQRIRQLVATTFLNVGPKMLSERDKAKLVMDVVDEQVDSVGKAFLGLTLGCARCHDHKFDPIPTADYYALAGIFKSTVTLEGESQQYVSTWVETPLPMPAELVAALAESKAQRAALAARLRDTKKSLKKAQEQLAALDKQAQAAPAPVVTDLPQDDADKTKEEKKPAEIGADQPAEPPATPQPLDPREALKQQIAADGEQVKQLEADLKEFDKRAPKPLTAMAAREAKDIADCAICVRGEHNRPGKIVERGFLQVLATDEARVVDKSSSGRRELADWIARAENPLTARVMVNRIWQKLLGEGLVRTVDNFGRLGEAPSHPELLDYLAVRFMQDGWSVKSQIRSIVLSNTYAQSSRYDDRAFEVDPDNRLLWRMNRKRLPAESLRDSILLAAGRLELAPGASPVAGLGALAIDNSKQDGSGRKSDSALRSIYLPIVRNELPSFLTIFDFADPDVVTGRRPVTNVPAQALYLLNNPFVVQHSQAVAERVLGDTADDSQVAEQVFLAVLGRSPSDAQRQRILDFLQAETSAGAGRQAAWTRVIQTLFASTEFRMLD